MKKKFFIISLLIALLLCSLRAQADGDFYVIAVGGNVGTKITSLPYTITAPGFYYVSSNLTCPSGDGITVNADYVTLDLMGFCLSGSGSGDGIYMDGRKNVEIRNGTLRGWKNGIEEANNLSIGHRVINIRAESNSLSGILLRGKAHLVKGCTAANNGADGIYIYVGTASGNQVTGCNLGIYVFIGNVISNMVNNNITGISINQSGSIIANTIYCDSGQTGITFSSLNPILVDQNTVHGPGTHYPAGGSGTAWGTNAGR